MNHNLNGQIVFNGLKYFDRPLTAKQIICKLAYLLGEDPNDIAETIIRTLEVGVESGFIQRKGKKYFIDKSGQNNETTPPMEVPDDNDDNDEYSDESESDDTECDEDEDDDSDNDAMDTASGFDYVGLTDAARYGPLIFLEDAKKRELKVPKRSGRNRKKELKKLSLEKFINPGNNEVKTEYVLAKPIGILAMDVSLKPEKKEGVGGNKIVRNTPTQLQNHTRNLKRMASSPLISPLKAKRPRLE